MGGFVGILIFILDVLAVIECAQNQKDMQKKVLWIALILILPILGLILYHFLERKNYKKVAE